MDRAAPPSDPASPLDAEEARRLAGEHGIKPDEYDKLLAILGRAPNITELGVYSAMWSEHCSYKSSRVQLKKFPTTGPRVVHGPGENAGVVDIGDGQVAVFKMESHNHPSFIEPYQGAATGVGGIMRDVFTMGARPVANLNALRFGSADNPHTPRLLAGVVAGIGGYGNCVGVPTVGGETNFEPGYDGNILVNAMCVGVADADKVFTAKAEGVGNPIVYVGSKTGRDGIHGASMSSAEFDDQTEEKRPTVQVGDPFAEKLLIEACLELMGGDAVVAIQDMGAAGLTSSLVEMCAKGGLGAEVDLDQVPMREEAMTAYEIMLSESQERMLMILKPGREDAARAIFEKWDLDAATIGRLTDTGRLILKRDGAVAADMAVGSLADSAPVYHRAVEATPAAPVIHAGDVPEVPALDALLHLMGSADLSSRAWIWEQYDSQVMADTILASGGDAAVVRVHGTRKGLALTSDVTPRYCLADPKEGGRQAVAEACRNLACVGAAPIGLTNCLNFGNPEKPRIMGQIAGCVEGMSEAARAFDAPIVSGNVSLYNETNGAAIPPTPTVGAVGLIPDIAHVGRVDGAEKDDRLILLGAGRGWLGRSLYLRHFGGGDAGAPPPVSLDRETALCALVRDLIMKDVLHCAHDVSDGGLLVAAAEMALAANQGLKLNAAPGETHAHAHWFGEDQGRILVAADASHADLVLEIAGVASVPAAVIGRFGGAREIRIDGASALALDRLRAAHESFLPRLMGEDAAA